MIKHITFLKKVFVLLLVCLVLACKNKEQEKIENPITSKELTEEITSVPANFSTEKLFQKEATAAFYKARDYTPVWNKKEFRTSFFEQLKKAGEEGLFFNDYHGKELQRLLQNKDDLKKEDQVSLEILLTDAFLNYAHDLFYGKLNPKKMYEIWGIDRKQIDLGAVLQKAIEKHEIEKALEALKPQNEIYAGLKKSLQEYKELIKEEGSFKKINAGDPIKPGKTDERIPTVASRLKQLGVLNKNYVVENNIYDQKLQTAVKEFQNQKGLITDGVLGNRTLQELNMGAKQRYDQLLANLERWRWYPRDLGKQYILINIPDFRLTVIKNGKTTSTHKVIVGDKTHHTPVFSDSVQYIVINPKWHIPSSIRNAEIIPAASANPNYLSSRNIYVTGPNGNRINPSTINWSSGEAKNYRFTQGSGPSNSLGRVKIIYPNKYAIYLHDTPAQTIFSQNSRAESHGCVRVENAVKFAAYILNDQEKWNLDKIMKVISSGQTKQVSVTQPIHVHHFYWTARRKKNETIFINDIYGLDKAVYSALKK